MTTGQRIKEARKEKGITQTELGQMLGVSGSMIAQYETDKRKPKQETIQRIANALQCDFYWLLWGEKISDRDRIAMNTLRLFNIQDKWDQKIVDMTIKHMEYELGFMGYSFSEAEKRVIKAFSKLDDDGQKKVADYAEDMLSRYRAIESPQSSQQKNTDTPYASSSETPPDGK